MNFSFESSPSARPRRAASRWPCGERDHQPLLAHHGDVQVVVRLRQPQPDDPEVQPAIDQFLDLAGRGEFGQADLHVGVVPVEGAEHRRQPFIGELRDEPDGEPARFPPRGPDGGPRAFVRRSQQAATVVQEHLPRRRQRDVVPVTVQQQHAEFFFQLMNLDAQRGLRDVEAFGGAAEAEFLGGRDEVPDVTKLHNLYGCIDNLNKSPRQLQSNSVLTNRGDFDSSIYD